MELGFLCRRVQKRVMRVVVHAVAPSPVEILLEEKKVAVKSFSVRQGSPKRHRKDQPVRSEHLANVHRY